MTDRSGTKKPRPAEALRTGELESMVQIKIKSEKIDEIISKWNADAEFAIEMMQDIQDSYRHLPRQALLQISKATKIALGRLYHIATFYKAFSLEPRGQHSAQVCMGTACHVRGATRVMDAFSRTLEVEPGKTTSDLKYSLEGVRCLGCCSLAPVVAMDDEIFSHVDSSMVKMVLRRHERTTRERGEEGDA